MYIIMYDITFDRLASHAKATSCTWFVYSPLDVYFTCDQVKCMCKAVYIFIQFGY